MSDPLAELKRQAYARPVEGADPLRAQVELRRITDEARDAPPLTIPELPRVRTGRGALLAAVGAVAALALASGSLLVPHPSLDIFASAQTGAPEWPGAAVGDDRIRWLGSLNGWDVFGLLTAGDNVCVTTFANGVSGGGACTSRAGFLDSGLSLGTSRGNGSAAVVTYLSVRWGPDGPARLSAAPLGEARR